MVSSSLRSRRREDQAALREEEGRLRNYLGFQYMWGGIRYPQHRSFFIQAELDLRAAADLLRDWYQPHENLGDTYRFWSRTAGPDARRIMLLRAIAEYRKAWMIANHLRDSAARNTVTRRVRVAQAIAMILTERSDFLSEATELVREAEREWQPLEERDVPTLYNVGCFYALLAKVAGDASAESTARRYLVIALLRDDDFTGEYLVHDNDVRDVEGVALLRESTLTLIQQSPFLPEAGRLPEAEVDEAIRRVEQWVAERGGVVADDETRGSRG